MRDAAPDVAAELVPLADAQLHELLCTCLDPAGRSVECVSREVFKRRRDWRGLRLFEKLTVRVRGEAFPVLLLKYNRPADEWRSLNGAEREAGVYRHLLDPARLGSPQFFGMQHDRDSGAALLLMEFVNGKRLKKFTDEATWIEIARWLAALHHRFAGEDRLAACPSLVRHDGVFLWQTARAAAELAARSSARAGALMDRVLARYQRVVDPLTRETPTLIHGEFYCTNILVGGDAEHRRVCAFDWETAAAGCSFLDLTCLVQQRRSKTVVDRSRLVAAYVEARRRLGGPEIAVADAEAQIRRCKLQLLILDIWTGVRSGQLAPEKIEKYAQLANDQLDGLD